MIIIIINYSSQLDFVSHNTVIIENVNIRHTQLVQALASYRMSTNVRYKTNTVRLSPHEGKYSQS